MYEVCVKSLSSLLAVSSNNLIGVYSPAAISAQTDYGFLALNISERSIVPQEIHISAKKHPA